MAKHPVLDVPALFTTCVEIQASDLGLRFSFGEENLIKSCTKGGEKAYHTSVFLPIQYVPTFEKHYKDVVAQYMEAKQKQSEEKQNAIQQKLG